MIIDITIPHLKKKYILKILHYITLFSIYLFWMWGALKPPLEGRLVEQNVRICHESETKPRFSILLPLFWCLETRPRLKQHLKMSQWRFLILPYFCQVWSFQEHWLLLAIPGNPQTNNSPQVSNSLREPKVSFTTANLWFLISQPHI